MSVTVGPRREQAPLTAADVRELEILLNLSRNKREALGAWLRRLKVPMDSRIREQLVTMDRYLDEWYEVALVDCDELYEIKKAVAMEQDDKEEEQHQEAQEQQRREEVPEPAPAPSTVKGRGRGGRVVAGRGGPGSGTDFCYPWWSTEGASPQGSALCRTWG